MSKELKMCDQEQILGMVGVAWCTEGNEHKTMDSVLAVAMSKLIIDRERAMFATLSDKIAQLQRNDG